MIHSVLGYGREIWFLQGDWGRVMGGMCYLGWNVKVLIASDWRREKRTCLVDDLNVQMSCRYNGQAPVNVVKAVHEKTWSGSVETLIAELLSHHWLRLRSWYCKEATGQYISSVFWASWTHFLTLTVSVIFMLTVLIALTAKSALCHK